MGCRGPGQDPAAVETLLPEHSGGHWHFVDGQDTLHYEGVEFVRINLIICDPL